MVRLIASDLDGTLFGADKVPAPRTVQALNRAAESGVIVVAVTGRSYFGGADRVVSTGAQVDWFIGSNGGHRLNMATRTLEERLVFGADHVATLRSGLGTHAPGIGFGFEHAGGFTYDAGFHAVLPHSFDGGMRRDSAIWASDDIGKIFATHPTLGPHALIDAATPLAPAGTHVTKSSETFVEFTPAGADKALGLARLCEKLGIAAEDVIAFGDNNNDVSMLQWAGRGVAMGNATPEATAAADQVTDTNVNFGVAQVLETIDW